MEISAQVRYPFDEVRAQGPELAALPESELRELLADSLVRQVMAVADEELRSQGL